jgi:hypothetical protein
VKYFLSKHANSNILTVILKNKTFIFLLKEFFKKNNQSILHLACGKKNFPVGVVAVLLKNSPKDAKLAKDTVSNYFLFTRL